MGESVIYSSVMACILASIASLKTRVVAFDTEIVDLTEKSDDPVDLLYGFQLGGGTDSPIEPLWSISKITVNLLVGFVLALSKK